MKYLKILTKNNNNGKIERQFFKIEVKKIKKTILQFKKGVIEVSIKYGLFRSITFISDSAGTIRILAKIKNGGRIISINPYGY